MSFLIRLHFIDKTYSYQSSRFLWSVCVLGTPASSEKTAESIEMLFFFGGGQLMSAQETKYRWGADWRHPANRIKRSMRGGNAALCQITLTTCEIYYILQLPQRD